MVSLGGGGGFLKIDILGLTGLYRIRNCGEKNQILIFDLNRINPFTGKNVTPTINPPIIRLFRIIRATWRGWQQDAPNTNLWLVCVIIIIIVA